MKATNVIGIALIGVALLLVGLNFYLPNWAAGDSSENVAATPLPTLGHISHFSTTPDDIVAQTPSAADDDLETPHPIKHVHHVHKAHKPLKAVHKKISTQPMAPLTESINAPLPAPAMLGDNDEKSVEVTTGTDDATPHPAKIPAVKHKAVAVEPKTDAAQMIVVPSDSGSEISAATASPSAAKRLAALTPHFTRGQLARFHSLRHAAQSDAIRRTAIGMAMQAVPGTHVESADIEDLGKNTYRVLLVEHNLHGTIVESIKFQGSDAGGFVTTGRHVISSTASDPFVTTAGEQ